MRKREQMKSDILRKQIKQRTDANMSLSSISKELGISYGHTKQLAEQNAVVPEDKEGE